MKRVLCALVALLPTCVYAQTTPNLNFQIPAYGSAGWGTRMNQNFTALDGYLSGQAPIPMITLSGAITNSNQAATKAYVDAAVAGGGGGGGGGGGNATQLQATPIAATVPTTGQFLSYNGTTWTPVSVSASNATSIQGVTVAATAPSSGQVLAYNGTTYTPQAAGCATTGCSMTGTLNSSTLKNGNLSSIIVVDGSKYAQTSAGVQSAVNDSVTQGFGGTVFLASGNYTWTSTVTIQYPIHIRGAGWSTFLNISGLASTVDVFHVVPPVGYVTSVGTSFKDFWISDTSTSGRYGIFFDGTNGLIGDVHIENVQIDPTNGPSIYASGSGNGNGNLRTSTIGPNNVFSNGIACHQCGDTLHIENNMIQGVAPSVDADFVPGAANLVVAYNNMVSTDGCVHIGTGSVNDQIIGNECETPTGAVGSNGALFDIDGVGGSGGNNPSSPVLSGNSCQIVNGSSLNCIRVNLAHAVNIHDNNFARGASPSTDIVVTANAVGTLIGTNNWAAGFPYSRVLSDSGTGTSMVAMFNGQPTVMPGTSFYTFNSAGTALIPQALVSGTTATTQTTGDFSNNVATDAFVQTAIAGGGGGGGGGGLAYSSPTLNAIPSVSNATGFGTVVNSAFSDDTNNTFDNEPFHQQAAGYMDPVATATSGANQPSNAMQYVISYWNGSTAVSTQWQNYAFAGSGTNPATLLIFYGPPTLATNTVLFAVNPALPATSSTNYSTPKLALRGHIWNGSASVDDEWDFQGINATGTSPTSTLTLTHSGSTGNATVQMPATTFVSGNPGVCNNGVCWTTGSAAPTASCNSGDTYSRSGTSNSSTVVYVCAPANTWTAIPTTGSGGGGMTGTPTFVPDAGAGSSPTISLISGANDGSGWVSVKVGTSPTASAGITTIKYGSTYGTIPKCGLNPANAAAAALSGASAAYITQAGSTTALFVITGGSTALTAGSTYVWQWSCSL
jgi:hypothetical protein